MKLEQLGVLAKFFVPEYQAYIHINGQGNFSVYYRSNGHIARAIPNARVAHLVKMCMKLLSPLSTLEIAQLQLLLGRTIYSPTHIPCPAFIANIVRFYE